MSARDGLKAVSVSSLDCKRLSAQCKWAEKQEKEAWPSGKMKKAERNDPRES